MLLRKHPAKKKVKKKKTKTHATSTRSKEERSLWGIHFKVRKPGVDKWSDGSIPGFIWRKKIQSEISNNKIEMFVP